jgi:hypothetical protein
MTGGDDDGSGEKKSDPLKFWLNLISIIISGCISVGTGLLIYRLTLAQMRKVDTGEPGEGDLAVAALEQTALLGDYSDEDEVVEEELVPRRQPQEEV